MKNIFLPLFILILTANNFPQQEPAKLEEPYKFPQENHLQNIRMLTESGENAEAYLSFDEKSLVYQSTHGNLECDQIFTMSTSGSNRQLVSTGKGRTTCAYFLPDDAGIVYASTHHFSDECPPPPDRSKGYVWKLYDEFDIFSADISGSNIIQLTDAAGYDAEATVSPKGDKIVFTSTRDGDPEIYVMDIDGSNQTRLTFEKGYDGGAFFSHDGAKIVFRSSRPTTEKDLEDYEELVQHGLVRPTALEIFIMDADGSNIQQITSFGKASFAPFFHPDGKKIIFSSNVNSKSGRNFDLYLINIDGSGLEQITYNETFDGFPMFTSDGKRLVFASNRFNKNEGDTNIFIADWIE